MATSEEYAQWIVKNADKKGTPEFETVAKAYQSSKGASAAPTPAQQPDAKTDTGALSQVKAGGKAAFEETGSTAGGVAGAVVGGEAGAALGSLLGPAGTVVGGVGGALVGGFGGSKAGDAIQSGLGKLVPEGVKHALGFDEDQRAKEREAMPGATMVGEFTPAVASLKLPTKAFAEGVNKFAANRVWSDASNIQKVSLKTAEDWGLKVKPSQVQEGAQQRILGDTANQKIINTKAAEATGHVGEVSHVDEKFLNSRFDDLGKQYNKIYNDPSLGKIITMGDDAHAAIQNLLSSSVPIPTVAKTKLIALEKEMSTNAGSQTHPVAGEDFRLIMSELKKASRSTQDGNIRFMVNDAVGELNSSLAAHNPNVAKALADVNPKYRATATLDNAFQKGVVDVNGNLDAYEFGKMLRSSGKESSNPLYKLGQVGESLGIGSVAKGARVKSGSGQQLPNMGGVPQRLVGKTVDALTDTSAGRMVQQKARGSTQNALSGYMANTVSKSSPMIQKLYEMFVGSNQ